MSKYKCLSNDFQILLDKYGNLYHIDLDRCLYDPKQTNSIYNNEATYIQNKGGIKQVYKICKNNINKHILKEINIIKDEILNW